MAGPHPEDELTGSATARSAAPLAIAGRQRLVAPRRWSDAGPRCRRRQALCSTHRLHRQVEVATRRRTRRGSRRRTDGEKVS
jgi:hypothetical protein